MYIHKFGDHVWIIEPIKNPSSSIIRCPCCSGKGTITGDNKMLYKCPYCHGEKEVSTEPQVIYIPVKATIVDMQTWGGTGFEPIIKYYLCRNHLSEKELGFNPPCYWALNEDQIYKTKEQAKEAAKKKTEAYDKEFNKR